MKNDLSNWEFSATTNQVKVIVSTKFNAQISDIQQNVYIWFYQIRIENLREFSFKITDRQWQIFDSNGTYNEIKGKGLIGHQPIIEPHRFFEYRSQVQLFTRSGLMRGEYLATEFLNNSQFKIVIPAFSLDIDLDY